MSEQKKDFPDFYITAPQPCPYLPDKFERKLFTHLNRDKPRGIVDHLLTNGFRRSQNIAYTPYCEGCSACTSVRVIVDRFEPGRGFERILERNGDIVARERAAVPTAEQYRLFRAYVLARHSDGGMAEMSMLDYFMMVQDSIIDTFLTEYRIRPGGALAHEFDRWPLVGVGLSDRLGDGLSMVYSFFDPDLSDRSLGTFMILDHIGQARRDRLPFVYLGYWIAGSRKMSYKTRFAPQQHLTSQGWVERD